MGRKTSKVSAKPGTKKIGRPTDYNQAIADRVCNQIANGESLRTICDGKDDMPDKATVFRWLRIHEIFRDQYTRAREEAKWAMFDRLEEIATDGRNDWMEDQYMKGASPGWKVNGEAVQRSKLRIDTIKWQLSKLAPKEYGDKMDHTTNGKDLPAPILGGAAKQEKHE